MLLSKELTKMNWFQMIITLQMSGGLSPIPIINSLDINLCHNNKKICWQNSSKKFKFYSQFICIWEFCHLMAIMTKSIFDHSYELLMFFHLCALPQHKEYPWIVTWTLPCGGCHVVVVKWTFLLTWWN
jgi:hypothetical protein